MMVLYHTDFHGGHRYVYGSNKICPYTGAEYQLTVHILFHIDCVMLSGIQQVCGKT